MRDSNKVYEQFFIKCAEAGSERCALAARSPSKLVNEDEEAFIKRAAKDLQVNADQFISESWDTPMQVEKGQNGPGLLTAQDLSFVVSQITAMGVTVLTWCLLDLPHALLSRQMARLCDGFARGHERQRDESQRHARLAFAFGT